MCSPNVGLCSPKLRDDTQVVPQLRIVPHVCLAPQLRFHINTVAGIFDYAMKMVGHDNHCVAFNVGKFIF